MKGAWVAPSHPIASWSSFIPTCRGKQSKQHGALILIVAATACAPKKPAATVPLPSPRQAIVADMKAFEHTLGVEATNNFLRYSASVRSFNRCYFTGKLELPASYRDLRVVEGTE